MNKNEVIARLKEHQPELDALGIDHLRLFGSVARDDAGPQSDIDLVVEFNPAARIGFAIVSIHKRLEEILGQKVDLLRAPIERRELNRTIEREGIYAF